MACSTLSAYLASVYGSLSCIVSIILNQRQILGDEIVNLKEAREAWCASCPGEDVPVTRNTTDLEHPGVGPDLESRADAQTRIKRHAHDACVAMVTVCARSPQIKNMSPENVSDLHQTGFDAAEAAKCRALSLQWKAMVDAACLLSPQIDPSAANQELRIRFCLELIAIKFSYTMIFADYY
ncbi:hypothetical protein ACJJTC_018812 [Scirpophaga incertulas]